MNITNLKKSTWSISDNWSVEAGYGIFNITGLVNNIGFTKIYLGYVYNVNTKTFTSAANYIVICGDTIEGFVSTNSFVLAIAEGEDTNKLSLINWLNQYGELLSIEPEDTKVHVQYNDTTLVELQANEKVKLKCNNKKMTSDLVISVPDNIANANIYYQQGYEVGYEKGKSEGSDNYYDTFWDLYQDNGNRTNYSGAFAGRGWTDETFKPKYDIVPITTNKMFSATGIKDLITALENANVKLDFSKVTTCSYLADDNAVIERIPTLDTTSLKSLSYFLYNCPNLTYIEKIILRNDGTQTLGTYTINVCPNLEEIRFEGVIGQSGLKITSTKLSKASIKSVINVLSATTSGFSITLSETAVNNAFTGENILQVIPNTNTSGTNKTNTIYLTKTTKDAVCGMAEIEGGKSYTIKRNLAGKEWRYFFYDTYPLDTGASSIDGAYLASPYMNNLTHTFTAPENAKYVVVRGAEGLTDEEVQNFTLTCGVAGSQSPEWLTLIDTKDNWTISLL